MIAIMNTNQEAREIAKQIGNKAFAMMGAKNLVADFRTLTFKIGRNAGKITHIRISLNMADAYNVTFFNIRGINVKEVKHLEDVYSDQLHNAIEINTGMYLTI